MDAEQIASFGSLAAALVAIGGFILSARKFRADNAKAKADMQTNISQHALELEERQAVRNRELADEIADLRDDLKKHAEYIKLLVEHIERLEDIIKDIDPTAEVPKLPAIERS